MKTTTKVLFALSTAALLTAGCDPQISGEQGNLTLTYDKGGSPGATGASPLAVGATLDYSAHLEGEKDKKVSFTSATSSDDSVILVDGVEGGLMTLEGIGEGEAVIDVDADGPDGAITDAFSLDAATVDALEFAHPCAPEDEAVYLVDHDINLHYKMRSEGRLAVGYGYYPVTLEPSDGAELTDTTTNGLLPLQSSAEAGAVTVSSELEDASEIELTFIEEGDIDGVQVFEEEFDLPTSVDNTLDLHLLPTVEGLLSAVEGPVPVCQSDIEIEVANDTPETCELAYGSAEGEEDSLFNLYEPNALAVTGKAEGTCEFTVTIPAANDGQGADASFSVDVLADDDEA
ncbi:MAG: hypothetical protein ACLFVJ_14840 [Persicimonas sp.]